MNNPRDILSDNSILRPIALACNTLSSAGTCYSHIEREGLGILKVSLLLICQRDANFNIPQAPGIHIKKRYCNVIIEATMYPIRDIPVQNEHNLQPMTRLAHCWLAIKTKPLKRLENGCPTIEHKCHWCSNRHPYMHDVARNTGGQQRITHSYNDTN